MIKLEQETGLLASRIKSGIGCSDAAMNKAVEQAAASMNLRMQAALKDLGGGAWEWAGGQHQARSEMAHSHRQHT